MKIIFAAAVAAGLLVSSALAAQGIVVTPNDESVPPNPATIHDGRGDVLAFHWDGVAPKSYMATVRCKNGQIGETPGMVSNWQFAIDQAFAACGTP